MKVFRLILEENDGVTVRRAERSLTMRECERLSVCARGQVLDTLLYELNREFEKKSAEPLDKTQRRD